MNYTLVAPTDPILHERMPEWDFDAPQLGRWDLRVVAVGMWELMRKPNKFDDYGVGLAAPQVGVRARMFVLHRHCTTQRFTMADVCINPSFQPLPGNALCGMKEGCLTWPGRRVDKLRYQGIKATWTTLSRKVVVRELYGIVAQAFQHELDHLDGRTIL